MRPTAMPSNGKIRCQAAKPARPATRSPWPYGRPRPYPATVPFPVFERLPADPAPDAPDAPDPAGPGTAPDTDLIWRAPEQLADMRRPAKAGLFVIERTDGEDRAPLHVGMSATNVGDARR